VQSRSTAARKRQDDGQAAPDERGAPLPPLEFLRDKPLDPRVAFSLIGRPGARLIPNDGRGGAALLLRARAGRLARSTVKGFIGFRMCPRINARAWAHQLCQIQQKFERFRAAAAFDILYEFGDGVLAKPNLGIGLLAESLD